MSSINPNTASRADLLEAANKVSDQIVQSARELRREQSDRFNRLENQNEAMARDLYALSRDLADEKRKIAVLEGVTSRPVAPDRMPKALAAQGNDDEKPAVTKGDIKRMSAIVAIVAAVVSSLYRLIVWLLEVLHLKLPSISIHP